MVCVQIRVGYGYGLFDSFFKENILTIERVNISFDAETSIPKQRLNETMRSYEMRKDLEKNNPLGFIQSQNCSF